MQGRSPHGFGACIITVFCAGMDWFEDQQFLRRRGPKRRLSDSEVLTIEIAGKYLDIDTNRGFYAYFRWNCVEWFPALKEIHHTTSCHRAVAAHAMELAARHR